MQCQTTLSGVASRDYPYWFRSIPIKPGRFRVVVQITAKAGAEGDLHCQLQWPEEGCKTTLTGEHKSSLQEIDVTREGVLTVDISFKKVESWLGSWTAEKQCNVYFNFKLQFLSV